MKALLFSIGSLSIISLVASKIMWENLAFEKYNKEKQLNKIEGLDFLLRYKEKLSREAFDLILFNIELGKKYNDFDSLKYDEFIRSIEKEIQTVTYGLPS